MNRVPRITFYGEPIDARSSAAHIVVHNDINPEDPALPFRHPPLQNGCSNQPVCSTGLCTVTEQQVWECIKFIFAHSRRNLYPFRPDLEVLEPQPQDPRYAYKRCTLDPSEAITLHHMVPQIHIPEDRCKVVPETSYENVVVRIHVNFLPHPYGYVCHGAIVVYGPPSNCPVDYRVVDCLEDNTHTALWLLEPYFNTNGAPVNGAHSAEYPTMILAGASEYNTIVPRNSHGLCNIGLLQQRRHIVCNEYRCCRNTAEAEAGAARCHAADAEAARH